MRPGLFVVLSGCLTFGVPLVLALRELWLLNRGNDRSGGWRPPPAPQTGPKPLPPCLLEAFQPRTPATEKPRVLEPA